MILRVTTSLYPIIYRSNQRSRILPKSQKNPMSPMSRWFFPRLLAIQPITESVFQLQYNLPVDIREAIFSISGIGNASRMTYADDMRIHVNISFDKELKVGMGYDLLCSGLMDLEGNKIPESSTEIRLEYEEEPDAPEEPEVPDTPSFPAGSIRINEVMADPKGQKAFPETEYVELYNTTDKAIELNGWSFLYGSKPTVLQLCFGCGWIYRALSVR